MSDLAPTYAFFADTYGADIPEDAFNAGVSGAESFVKDLIGFNEVDTPEKVEAYQRAICAATEAFALYGDGVFSGFTIGSFSVSQASGSSGMTARQAAIEKVAGELLKSGLLFSGVA